MPEEEHDRQVIPIVEETVRIDKRQTVSGKVRVRTEVNSVEQVVGETLTDETVEVTRVPINRRIEQIPEVRTETGVTILPLIEERLVVESSFFCKKNFTSGATLTQRPLKFPLRSGASSPLWNDSTRTDNPS